MVDGINVNYTTLDECISGLKTITVRVGGDEISRLVHSLDNIFVETNSDVANKLLSVKTKYSAVNTLLINIAANAIDVLEMAKKAYEHADIDMKGQIGSV